MNPEEMQEPQQPQQQPLTIEQVIQAYMQTALAVQGDPNLNLQVKSQAMLQMAQALSTLVPLTTADNGQAELQMKAQEHQMNLAMKQKELEMKQQEHVMKLQHSQAENEMKLQQAQQNHANSLVQSQQSHQVKLQQSAQSKPTIEK
jgi:hypothetical protein